MVAQPMLLSTLRTFVGNAPENSMDADKRMLPAGWFFTNG